MSKLEIRNLSKNYGKTLALRDLNLAITDKKIYGLLGRNGAGKTTLLNLITDKIYPTEGAIYINGKQVDKNKGILNEVYYMSEQNLYPMSLRVVEVFKWTKEFYPKFDLSYAQDLATKFNLDIQKKVKALSTGYSSIFKAILTLASNAEILLFDEPILGLDANHRELLYKELLAHYAENPKIIILSTHLIEEIADVLEEVIIVKEGELILRQSVDDLLASAYKVAGEIGKVDKYVQGKRCVGEQTLQNFKSVIVLSQTKDLALADELGLDLGQVELQKLFIGLTNS